MAENLNAGIMLNSTSNQTNNGHIDKYCYNNIEANCEVYGGLYQWREMMQYVYTPGTKGICPDGWHLPTDPEYCTLTLFIDTTVNCAATGYSGTEVGTKMKSTTGWSGGGNGTNTSGFTALPGGFSSPYGGFGSLTSRAQFWSSSEYNSSTAWFRFLLNVYQSVYRNFDDKYYGYSVRCLRD